MPSRFTRKEIWAHNALLGGVVFARKSMGRIINSTTATPKARQRAYAIDNELAALAKLLKERDE